MPQADINFVGSTHHHLFCLSCLSAAWAQISASEKAQAEAQEGAGTGAGAGAINAEGPAGSVLVMFDPCSQSEMVSGLITLPLIDLHHSQHNHPLPLHS